MNPLYINTIGIVLVALITTVGAIIIAQNNKKINEIHVMVNSNLQAAIEERKRAMELMAELNVKQADILTNLNLKQAQLLADLNLKHTEILAETIKKELPGASQV